jgi:hypothetical protein
MSKNRRQRQLEADGTPPLDPIEKLIQNIKTTREVAELDLSQHVDARTLPGVTMAKREAQDNILQLEKVYANYLNQVAIAGVLLAKDSTKAPLFLALAEEESAEPPVVVDARALYTRLAHACEGSLGATRLFGAAQIGLVIEELAAVGRELGLSEVGGPKWEYDNYVPTFESLVATIRAAIRRGGDGDDLNRFYIRSQAFKSALKHGYSANIVPVFVTGVASDDEAAYMAKKVFRAGTVFDLDRGEGVLSEINKESVLYSFKELVRIAKSN